MRRAIDDLLAAVYKRNLIQHHVHDWMRKQVFGQYEQPRPTEHHGSILTKMVPSQFYWIWFVGGVRLNISKTEQ